MAYLLYIDLFFAPVQQLSQVFDGYQQASVSLAGSRNCCANRASTRPAAKPLRRCTSLRGEIAFEDVHFSYGDEEEAPRRASTCASRPGRPSRSSARPARASPPW
ncbi:hypothetical protein SFUMM280S_10984 [Streptomyces fumanus]